MSTQSLPPTQRSLPIALIRARERVMAPIREMLQASGITEQQWRVLRVLSDQGAQDATELAERAALLQPSLTRILKTLNERAFITRTQDKADRRRQVVALTPAGQTLLSDNLAEATRISHALRDTLGPADFDHLLDLLKRLDSFSMTPPDTPHMRKDPTP